MIEVQVNENIDPKGEPVLVFIKGISTTAIDIERNGTSHFVSDLTYSNEYTVGQIFNSVARYFNKSQEDYGQKWVKFRNSSYNVSGEFKAFKNLFDACENDFEKVNIACEQLGEPKFVAEFKHKQDEQ